MECEQAVGTIALTYFVLGALVSAPIWVWLYRRWQRR